MNKKLNVAVLNTQPPHLYFGGVERRIIETAKLLEKKVNMIVYSGTKKSFKEKTLIDGATLVPCSSTDSFYPLDNWSFNRTVSRMAESITSDIIEAHTVSGYKLLQTLKKQKIGKPFIHTIHGVLADEYIQSSKSLSPSLRMKLSNFVMRHLAKLEKQTAKEASIIVTVSNYSAQKIVQLYDVNQNKIRVVPNGVDLNKFKPYEDSEKLRTRICGNCEYLVLFVGNLIPRKGLHYLVEAAKNITKESRDTKFVLVGEGPIKNHLIQYSKEQGVSENFIFLGQVPETMLKSLYSCADVFASPSIQEGQGISLLEAQASEKPVVAFKVTAITEVVKNRETGLLVKPDSTELANAILSLLSDKTLREKMGRSGREFVVKNFSWDMCAKRMLQVYSEVSKMV